LFLPRCLALAGRRDARPGGGARTLLSRGSEVLYEPPVRLLGLVPDLPLQPPLGWRGEDPDRVAVAVAVRGAGGQLEASDLLPDQGGPAEGVVLLPAQHMPAQHGQLSVWGKETQSRAVSGVVVRDLVPEGHRNHRSVPRPVRS